MFYDSSVTDRELCADQELHQVARSLKQLKSSRFKRDTVKKGQILRLRRMYERGKKQHKKVNETILVSN